ncbi:L-threonylcarbamoyladenylate synthase [Candidatus Pelagibacter communis]|uniref:L-threonylcarbamoyladenylate synthase n=1 Tax=Pelagibacter ubique TaxID=198252 RepID=UPI00094CA2BC|nr:L-threonylcarbamoyladenylate synthase [Candidatus Pelagibacter ubique]
MKNIYSNIFSFNKQILKKTEKSLIQGEIAVLPTETVYGLAGNAYSRKAINKIFKLKKRPKKNPLIVHYYNFDDARKDIILNNYFIRLYKKYCPGPLTFILKKNKISKIDSQVTAGMKTIAIRFPKNKIIRSLLKSLNFPLAMPSANISSGLSPVTAFDVFDEFKKRINIIINGGRTKIGIESTVIDLTSKPKILRPGIIDKNEIKEFLKINLSKRRTKFKSPGMFKKHYSPGIPVILGKKPNNTNQAYIVFGKNYKNKTNYFNLSKNGNLKEAAANLYKIMRKIKNKGYKKIFVSKIPNSGPGIAINDRLKRAGN